MTEHRRKPIFPLFVVLAGIFFLAAALALVWLNKDTPLAGSPQDSDLQVANETIPYPEVERISPEDAKTAFDTGSAVFVDVRDAGSYADHHIPGSVSIPLGELTGLMGELDSADWIIPYCT